MEHSHLIFILQFSDTIVRNINLLDL